MRDVYWGVPVGTTPAGGRPQKQDGQRERLSWETALASPSGSFGAKVASCAWVFRPHFSQSLDVGCPGEKEHVLGQDSSVPLRQSLRRLMANGQLLKALLVTGVPSPSLKEELGASLLGPPHVGSVSSIWKLFSL